MPKIAILILNWNGWKDTLECLDSICLINYSDFEVFIFDNNSSNKSVEEIKNWKCKQKNINILEYHENDILKQNPKGKNILNIHLIKNVVNYGFSKGNNLAVKKITNELGYNYIFLLNNDTVVNQSVLSSLIYQMVNNKKIAAVSPLVYYYKSPSFKDNTIYCFGSHINMYTGIVAHKFMGKNIQSLPIINNVNFLEASALMIDSKIFLEIGGFDEKFFAYFEDVDLSVRLTKNGYSLVGVSESKIWHKVSRSSNSSKKAYFLIRNLIWFMKKNASFLQLFIFYPYLFVRFFYLILIKSHFNYLYIKSVLRGFYDGFSNIN